MRRMALSHMEGTAVTNLSAPTRRDELHNLKQNGILTEQEFNILTAATVVSAAPAAKSELPNWILAIGLVVSVIAFDHLKGPIFPDFLYCVVSAGVEIQQPAQRRANGWMAGNGCSAGDPRCATSWIDTPASSVCLHGTLWEAIRKKVP